MAPLRQAQDSASTGSGRALPGTGPLLLEIDLTTPPADPAPGDPLARFTNRGRAQRGPLLRALHEAGSDRRVVGLVAKVGGPLPWALAQELRLGVRAFAASRKPTDLYEGAGSGRLGLASGVVPTGLTRSRHAASRAGFSTVCRAGRRHAVD